METLESIKTNRISLQLAADMTAGTGLTDLSTIKKHPSESNESKASNLRFLDEIESNEEFKTAFKGFIDGVLKFDGARKISDKYVKFMEFEMNKQEKYPEYEIDSVKIEEAKNMFLNHPDIKALDNDTTNFDFKTYELEIEKKFPKQMHELKKLMNTGDGMRRATALKDLGKRMGIDYDKIKRLLDKEYHNEVPETGEISEEMDEEIAQKMRGEKKFEAPKASGEAVKYKTFVDNEVRSLSELLSQLDLSGDLDAANEIKELENEYKRVKQFLNQWEGKDEQAVRRWARRKKGQLQREEFLEALAMMDQGNYLLTKGHRLRDPQIFSILVFMRSKENQGKLCQIQTGEGKTVIVSLLATMKVLQGKQVDVITSNQVLAMEGVTSRKDFYELLGISVDCNNADENYKRGPRECYKADVVYGSIGNFQFDYLRDSFEGFETRAERKFDTVLLDEVDSMLIDNGGYVAKLAGPFPGIESLKYVYLKIWQELIKAQENSVKDIEESLSRKAEELKQDITLSEDELQERFDSFRSEILKSLKDDLKYKIKATNPADFFLIPNHLKAYAKSSVDTWIDNALYAHFDCNENEKYVIKDKDGENQIVPVDYQNTGVTLRNTIWSNGLHQFVQLKHNLHLTAETLTTCFISNVGFIKLYKNNMFGLTGTLGSTNEQKMLSKAYNVDYAKIPTYKEKKFLELPGIVVSDDHWHNTVTLESFIMTRQKRSVLIICETIKELRDLEKNIIALKKLENFDELKLRIYPDEDSSTVTEEKVGESEIVIATNIAGRGTDFKTTKELEAAGGLHVFVSFLPVNKRVEDQAFGRTSRQGKSGTAQLIIKESDVIELGMQIKSDTTFEDVKAKRDNIEKERLDKIENVELAEIDFQDEIFSHFSELYKEFKEDNDNPYVIKDLKEYWAFWLHNKHYKKKNVKTLNVFDEFESFKLEASDILGSGGGKGRISHNPYYSILEAESFLSVHNINEARDALENAKILAQGNTDILCAIHMKYFEVAIESGCQLTERFSKALKEVFLVNLFADIKKDEAYKASGRKHLEEAKKSLEIEINYMKTHILGIEEEKPENAGNNKDFQRILSLIPGETNLLLKHLHSRYLALQIFHENVQGLQKQIDDSGDTKGLALNSKVPNFFRKPKTVEEKKIKESVTDKELNELSAVGIDYMYSLREVHDVPIEIIRSAQGQILAGIAALAAGILFPPILPIVAPIAGTLISEGISDIVIELISKGNAGFDTLDYVKGKLISYGISVVTMGMSAIASSVRILNQAAKACKAVANVLRKCRYFKKVCEKIAKYCDKFISYLNKLKHLKELAKLNPVMTKSQAFQSLVRSVGREVFQDVAMTVVSEKIVTASLERALENLKPEIAEIVKKTVNEKIDKQNLKLMKKEEMFKLTREIITGTLGQMVGEVFRDIALGVLRHSKSWKMKIASLALDTGISLTEVYNYAESFCEKFNEQSKGKLQNNQPPTSDEVAGESIDVITEQVTEKIYGMIMGLAGKYVNTFVVSPLMKKIMSGNDKKIKDEEHPDEEMKQTRKFNEIADAFETLGLKSGASMSEINHARREMMKKNHPDKNSNDPSANEKSQKINASYEVLKEFYNENQSSKTTATTVSKVPEFSNEFPDIVKNNPEMAHRGNIKTLSKVAEQHIVVKIVKENGQIIETEFGKSFKDNGNETIVLDYKPPKNGKLGHFEAAGDIEMQISSGPNNCFFDAAAVVMKSHGKDASPQQLRAMAEKPSFYNTMYDGLNVISKVLNNPLTKKMFQKSQAAILIGGAGGNKRKLKDIGDLNESVDIGSKTKKKLKNNSVDTDIVGPLASLSIQNYSFSNYVTSRKPFETKPEHKIKLSDGSEIIITQEKTSLAILKATYSLNQIGDKIKEKADELSFPKGEQKHFENIDVNKLYKNQKEMVAHLGDNKYITDDWYLQRGHAAAVADFLKVDDQLLTMDYLNAIPMWNKFNQSGGNWYQIESVVRKLNKNQSLRITTGALGVMKLKNEKIFLDHKNQRLPVPSFCFKIIDENGTGKKTVYLVSNNPYESKPQIKKQIVEMFGDNFTDFEDYDGARKFEKIYSDAKKGYTVTIPYEDFMKSEHVKFDPANVNERAIDLFEGKQINVIQDKEKLHILQVIHEIPQTDWKNKESVESFRWEKGKQIHFDNVEVHRLFVDQKKTFAAILTKNRADIYFNKAFSLERGHMAALADFRTIKDQKLTVNFLNVMPMWGVINRGSWGKIENSVRKRNVAENLRITAGGFGVMTLDGNEMYLSTDKKFPVPRYVYKLIENTDNGTTEFHVVYNNPHHEKKHIKAEIDKVFGSTVKHPKDSDYNANPKTGYTFTMDYNEFLKVTNI